MLTEQITMKKITLLIVLILALKISYAQNVDSLVYDQQRKKVNTLLQERSDRFSQYYQSLENKSGIFGNQTKKDVRRSNDILTEIVQADNEILKQTKVLVDYRVNAEKQIKEQAQEVSHQSDNRINGYMQTVNKLRSQNEDVKAESEQYKKTIRTLQISMVGIALFLIAALFILYQRSERKRREA